MVIEGQQIGLSGGTAPTNLPAHLHFEVLKQNKEKDYGYAFIDPYGWEGAPEIDHLAQINGMENFQLWNYEPRACLLNWAELFYGTLFSPLGAITRILYPYIYRFYKITNSYVGVSSIDNHVYYLGPDRVIRDEGNFSNWLSIANCQSPIKNPNSKKSGELK